MVCTHCSKEFVSVAGYHYHVANVCGGGDSGLQGGVVAAGVCGVGQELGVRQGLGGGGVGGGGGGGRVDLLSVGSAYPSAQRNKRKHGAMEGYLGDRPALHPGQGLGQGQGQGQGLGQGIGQRLPSDLSGRGRKTGLVVGRAIRSAFQAAAANKTHPQLGNGHVNGGRDHENDDDDDDECIDNHDERYHEEHAEYLRCKHLWLSTPSALFAAQVNLPFLPLLQ